MKKYAYLLALLLLIIHSPNLLAEGSKNINTPADTGNRVIFYGDPYLEVFVYANEGEHISLASSAMGYNGAYIELFDPSGRRYTYTRPNTSRGQGIIYTHTQEMGIPGIPESPGSGADEFWPFNFPVFEDEIGVWTIRFYPPSDVKNFNTPGRFLRANEAWNRTEHHNGNSAVIMAWDVTVSSVALNDEEFGADKIVDGRVFYQNMHSYAADNHGGASFESYVKTHSGIDYTVKLDQLQSVGSSITCNNTGITAADNSIPLFKSTVEDYDNFKVANSFPLDEGTDVFKSFLTTPDSALPTITSIYDGNDSSGTWLNVAVPQLISSIYNGITYDSEDTESSVCINFQIDAPGDYHIILDINENGSFDDAEDKHYYGIMSAPGDICLPWDGRDPNGDYILSREAYDVGIHVDMSQNVHLVLTDAEGNAGGISMTQTNGIDAGDTKISWNDTEIQGTNGEEVASPAHPWDYPFGDVKIMDTWASTDLTNPAQQSYKIFKAAPVEEPDTADLRLVNYTLSGDTFCLGDTIGVYAYFKNLDTVKVDSAMILLEAADNITWLPTTFEFRTNKSSILDTIVVDSTATKAQLFIDLDKEDDIIITVQGIVTSQTLDLATPVSVGICKPAGIYEPDFTGSDSALYPSSIDEFPELYGDSKTQNNFETVNVFANPSLTPEYTVSFEGVDCSTAFGTMIIDEIVGAPTHFVVRNINTNSIIADTITSDSVAIEIGEITEITAFQIIATIDHPCGTSTTIITEIESLERPAEVTMEVMDTTLCQGDSTMIEITGLEEGVEYYVTISNEAGQISMVEEKNDTVVYLLKDLTDNATVSVTAAIIDGCPSQWELTQNVYSGSLTSDIQASSENNYLCNAEESIIVLTNMKTTNIYTLVNSVNGDTLGVISDMDSTGIVVSGSDVSLDAYISSAVSGCSGEIKDLINLNLIEVSTPQYTMEEPVSGCDSAQMIVELDNTFPVENGYGLIDLNRQLLVGHILPNAEIRAITAGMVTSSTNYQLMATDDQGRCPTPASGVLSLVVVDSPNDTVDAEAPQSVCYGSSAELTLYGETPNVYEVWNLTSNELIETVTGADAVETVSLGEITESINIRFKVSNASCSEWSVTETSVDATTVEFELSLDGPEEMEEGCDSTTIIISRPNDRSAYDMDVRAYGQADLNSDYSLSSEEISFEKGQENASIVVAALLDTETEDVENLLLSIGTDMCSAPRQYQELSISDVAPIVIEMKKSITLLEPLDILIRPTSVTGGKGSYTYLWNGQEGHDQIAIYVESDTTITLTVIDECGNQVSHDTEIKIVPTGMDQAVSQFQVYPNPARETLNVNNLSNQTIRSIELINMNGQVVESSTQLNIQVDHLSTGIYSLRVTTDNNVEFIRVVIE